MKRLTQLLSVFCGLLLTADARAELITNGSFEVPVVVLSAAFFAGDPAITGWTVGGQSVDVTSEDYFGPAYDGAQYADLEGSPGPGSIGQSFPTDPGATYQLIFAYSRNVPGVAFFGADPSSALVTVIGSGTLLSETFESRQTGSENVWTPVTRFFVADSTLSTLTFASNNGPNGYYGGIQIDSVSVELGLAGDYNGDSAVDAADYTVWRDTLGQAGPRLAADGNANNQIDADDYEVWKENFGRGSGGMGTGSGAALPFAASLSPAVPEPSTFALATLGVLGLVARAGRRSVVRRGGPSDRHIKETALLRAQFGRQ